MASQLLAIAYPQATSAKKAKRHVRPRPAREVVSRVGPSAKLSKVYRTARGGKRFESAVGQPARALFRLVAKKTFFLAGRGVREET
eukprot:1393876-Amorphochlora_amoeboformis.AAC.1